MIEPQPSKSWLSDNFCGKTFFEQVYGLRNAFFAQ